MEEKEIYEYNVGNTDGYHHSYNTGMDEKPMSMGEWVITILVFMIPIAGLVLYCMWAFGKSGNVNRQNFCRAYLAITVVGFVISIVFCIWMAMVLGFAFSASPMMY